MITGLPGELPRFVADEAGANGYLNKPFRMEQLVSRVNDLLCRRGAPEVLTESPGSPASELVPASGEPPAQPGTFSPLGTKA